MQRKNTMQIQIELW